SGIPRNEQRDEIREMRAAQIVERDAVVGAFGAIRGDLVLPVHEPAVGAVALDQLGDVVGSVEGRAGAECGGHPWRQIAPGKNQGRISPSFTKTKGRRSVWG